MKEFDSLCKHCMKKIDDQQICPFCGHNQSNTQSNPYLQIGEILEQRYSVGEVLDKDTEGFGYAAYDNVLNTPVYIKEFFPDGLCYRSNNTEVSINSGLESKFRETLDSFLDYLRAVARIRSLTSIASVYNIFTENSTAYAVYEWVEGVKLTDFLEERDGYISWGVARPLFMPLLSSLSEMNSVGIQHLGICPENLVVAEDNKLRLINFSIPEVRKVGSSVPPTIYDGFSAIEQYIPDYQTSEATDVYSFAATLFFVLTGSPPQKAVKRKTDDRILVPTNLLRDIPEYVILSMANALQVFPEKRTLTFEKLRQSLSASHIINNIENLDDVEEEPEKEPAVDDKSKKGMLVGIISGIVVLLLLVGSGVYWLFGGSNFMDSGSQQSSSSVPSSSAVSSDINKIDVPNLLGQKFKTVQASIVSGSDYQVLLSNEEFNDSVAEGFIISQIPSNTDKMEKGGTILVTVSKGPKSRSLPEISGISVSDASQNITAAGFIPTQTQEYSDTVASGVVIGYADGHVAGEAVEYGKEIKIMVSKGKKES